MKKRKDLKKALIVVDMVNGFIREGNMKDLGIEKIIKDLQKILLKKMKV